MVVAIVVVWVCFLFVEVGVLFFLPLKKKKCVCCFSLLFLSQAWEDMVMELEMQVQVSMVAVILFT